MATEPKFINQQEVPVGVYTADKKKIYVAPYHMRDKPNEVMAVFEVKGEHYRQYLAPYGPLSPAPEEKAEDKTTEVSTEVSSVKTESTPSGLGEDQNENEGENKNENDSGNQNENENDGDSGDEQTQEKQKQEQEPSVRSKLRRK
jgi:hypothetical protein